MYLPDDATIDSLARQWIPECEQEPIHAPGKIQPHGVLLVLTEPGPRIRQVSANAEAFLGIRPVELLNRPLADLVGSRAAHNLGLLLMAQRPGTTVPLDWTIEVEGKQRPFFVTAHRLDALVLVELEPYANWEGQGVSPEEQKDFALLTRLREISDKIGATRALSTFAETVVNEVADLTGYDRVLLYRFDEDEHGAVIAEKHVDGMESYLGLHYPASDIPKRARDLYKRNRYRMLVDVAAPFVSMVPPQPLDYEQPLDMTYCTLRSVSANHTQYLVGMGVRASLGISVMHGDRLWGLLSCHHSGPMNIPPQIRGISDFLAGACSRQLQTLENISYSASRRQGDRLREALNEEVDLANEGIGSIIVQHGTQLRQMTEAEGMAFVLDGAMWLDGVTPTMAEITSILEQVGPVADADEKQSFVTIALGELFPQFADLRSVASGVYACRLDIPEQQGWLLFFRAHQIETVSWGRDLQRDFVRVGDSWLPSPERSFGMWQNQVEGRSRGWTIEQAVIIDATREVLARAVFQLRTEERRATELELTRVRQAFDHADQPVLILDQHQKPLLANGAFAKHFGHETRPLRLELDQLIPSPADMAALTARLQKSIQEGATGDSPLTAELQTAEGKATRVSVRTKPIVVADGVLKGHVLLFSTSSGHEATQARLEQWERNLLETQRLESLGILAGGIAHDFNNMLVAVIGNTSLVHQNPKAPEASAMLADVLAAAEAAAELSHLMLDYVGQTSRDSSPVNLEDLLSNMICLAKTRAHRGVELSYRSEPSKPPLVVRADRSQMRQLFMNLILNGIEASGAPTRNGHLTDGVSSKGLVHIETRLETITDDFGETCVGQLPPGVYCRIAITDNGCGMSTETREHIFDPFFTTKSTGRGLGLAAVLGILRTHHGALRVESEPGRGTQMLVYLPYLESREEVKPEDASSDSSSGGDAVLIDSDPYAGVAMRRILRQNGYETRLFHEPTAVLNNGHPLPNLIVVDLETATGDPAHYLQQLLQVFPASEMVAISTLARPTYLSDPALAGVAFLQKPFSAPDVTKMLQLVERKTDTSS